MFLDGSLPCLTKLNFSLQRADFIIHVLYDSLYWTAVVLMSRFMLPEYVRDFRKEKLSKQKNLEMGFWRKGFCTNKKENFKRHP